MCGLGSRTWAGFQRLLILSASALDLQEGHAGGGAKAGMHGLCGMFRNLSHGIAGQKAEPKEARGERGAKRGVGGEAAG